MKIWQLQEAKARLSEVVKNASLAPQQITLRGKPAAVVLSKKEYDNLITQKESLVDFIRRSPLRGIKLDVKRNKD